MTRDIQSRLIEAIPLPILMIGADNLIGAANAPLRDLLGDHVIGRHYVAALRQPSLLSAVADVLNSRQAMSASFTVIQNQNEAVYSVHVAPQDDHLILTFQDRTAQQDIGQMRRDFVANVSHELRTPLTALQGFIDTLQGPARDDPDARERFLGIMSREANRMTRLVDDLLVLSRVEGTARIKSREPVEVAKLVTTTVAEIEPVLAAKRARVVVTDDATGAIVAGNAEQLRQVLTNLIENAVKYGPDGGEVRIAVTLNEHEPSVQAAAVRIVVSDDGPGIAAHHLPRLTERFYRVDSHRSRDVGGTGLGLAIAKHIVQRHRGRLRIKSEEGKGTDVAVILPRASAIAEDAE